MKKNNILGICFIILTYVILSLLINKTYILPKVSEIIIALINIITNGSFISIVLITIFRTLLGVLISFILAILLSTIAYFKTNFREFFEPIYVFLKTIPNITYIIISLIWLGRGFSVVLVSMLVIFPIFYKSILNSYINIDPNLINVTRTFGNNNTKNNIRNIYIPLISKDILLALNNCLSLAFKVSIMAEILSQVKLGIGRELQFARSNMMMPEIFAWTIIIVIISLIFEWIIKFIVKKTSN